MGRGAVARAGTACRLPGLRQQLVQLGPRDVQCPRLDATAERRLEHGNGLAGAAGSEQHPGQLVVDPGEPATPGIDRPAKLGDRGIVLTAGSEQQAAGVVVQDLVPVIPGLGPRRPDGVDPSGDRGRVPRRREGGRGMRHGPRDVSRSQRGHVLRKDRRPGPGDVVEHPDRFPVPAQLEQDLPHLKAGVGQRIIGPQLTVEGVMAPGGVQRLVQAALHPKTHGQKPEGVGPTIRGSGPEQPPQQVIGGLDPLALEVHGSEELDLVDVSRAKTGAIVRGGERLVHLPLLCQGPGQVGPGVARLWLQPEPSAGHALRQVQRVGLGIGPNQLVERVAGLAPCRPAHEAGGVHRHDPLEERDRLEVAAFGDPDHADEQMALDLEWVAHGQSLGDGPRGRGRRQEGPEPLDRQALPIRGAYREAVGPLQ